MIDGSKIFITNAGTDITACVTITARTGDDEISNLIVPNGTPGYEISPPMEKLGWRASDTRELSFQGCAVPEGTCSASAARASASSSRSSTAAGSRSRRWASGSRRAPTTSPSAYAQEREQFGKPIASFQAIQFQLADMAVEIEAGRALVYKAAWLKDQGRPFAKEAAMAKLYTGELSHRVANQALQIHGGYGFMDEFGDLAPLPRPEDPRDRRGHERSPADGDRQHLGFTDSILPTSRHCQRTTSRLKEILLSCSFGSSSVTISAARPT